MRRCESRRKACEVARTVQDAGFSAVAHDMLAHGDLPVADMAAHTDMLDFTIVGKVAELGENPKWLQPAEREVTGMLFNESLFIQADELARKAICVLEHDIRHLRVGIDRLRLIDVAFGFYQHNGNLNLMVKAMRVLDGAVFGDDYRLLKSSERLVKAWRTPKPQIHAAA